MKTVFKPNCITATSHTPKDACTADVLALELFTQINRTIDQVQLSNDPKTIKNYTDGSLDAIHASLLLERSVADILILLADRHANSELYKSYRVESDRTNVVISDSRHGLKTVTTFSFEKQSETTPGTPTPLRYAVTLENGWVAAADIELDALCWGTDILKHFETQLLSTADASHDFSTVSFDRSNLKDSVG